ncbi:MAG: hypothetical protein ACPGSB_05115 [Opitutales bacterium]
MNNTSDRFAGDYDFKTKTIRLDRRYQFETSEDSETFADKLGTVISFPNLAVFVDPIAGKPEASVTIECRDDVINLATAYQLLDSFDELRLKPSA